MFIAWEEFIESAIAEYMMGGSTISNFMPVRHVVPKNRDHCAKLMLHTRNYFDYANHDNVRKIVKLYLDNGYPFEGPLASINSELADLKTIRNACAHLSSPTNTALSSLATRILGQPQNNITVYFLLTTIDPRVAGNNTTIYAAYRDKLEIAATLIAHG